MKLQSAMEYLMTYGWAILIVAVVLAALFELGVFNTCEREVPLRKLGDESEQNAFTEKVFMVIINIYQL
ncbi:MAG: hypothetical protein ACP5MZ_04090 [Candidatus Micrarchaeia archaeon]